MLIRRADSGRELALPLREVEAYSVKERARLTALQEAADHLFSELMNDSDRFTYHEFGVGDMPLKGYGLAVVDEDASNALPLSDPTALANHLTANAIVLDFGSSVDQVVLRGMEYKRLSVELRRYQNTLTELRDATNVYTEVQRRELAGEAEVRLFRAMLDFKQNLSMDGLTVEEPYLLSLARFLARLHEMPKPMFDDRLLLSGDVDERFNDDEIFHLRSQILNKTGVMVRYAFDELDRFADEREAEFDEYGKRIPKGYSNLLFPPGTSGVLKRMIAEEVPKAQALLTVE